MMSSSFYQFLQLMEHQWNATILVSERPKTHALDRAATGIGFCMISFIYFYRKSLTYN
jgi:hypothetical protein